MDFFKKLLAKLVGKNDFLLTIAFDFLKGEVEKIKFKPLRLEVISNLEPLEGIIKIFTDKDPDNAGQLSDWWKANREKVVDNKLMSAAEFIAVAKGIDPHYKAIVIEQLVTLAAQQLFKDSFGEDATDFVQSNLQRLYTLSAESKGGTVQFSPLLPIDIPKTEPKPVRRTRKKKGESGENGGGKETTQTTAPKRPGRPKKVRQ